MSQDKLLFILIWILSWILGQYIGKTLYQYLEKKKIL